MAILTRVPSSKLERDGGEASSVCQGDEARDTVVSR